MNETVIKRRQEASDQSLGSSHQVIYTKALELIKKFSKKDSILDFGAGRGYFVSLIKSQCEVGSLKAVDLMAKPEGFDSDIQWVQSDLNNSLELPDDSVGMISALEIIEHLENPRHVFRELYRVLKKDGVLILSTPNVESWRSILSLIKRGHFVDFTGKSYPAHITALNRQDLLRAAQESGFKLEEWSYTDSGCVPGWTSMTWQKLSGGLFRGLRYSDNLFIILRK